MKLNRDAHASVLPRKCLARGSTERVFPDIKMVSNRTLLSIHTGIETNSFINVGKSFKEVKSPT